VVLYFHTPFNKEEGHASLVTEKEDLNAIQSQSPSFIPRFQTPYEEYNNNEFRFDIYKIDSFLNLNGGEILGIIGEQKYTQLLVARLCVNALMMQSRTRRRRGEILGNFLIVISLSCRHQLQQQESLHVYNKILLPRFDKYIEIIDGGSSSSSSRSNGSFKVKTTITKNKNDHRAARESKLFSVTEKDLLILPWT
jgi:hypothetical protein